MNESPLRIRRIVVLAALAAALAAAALATATAATAATAQSCGEQVIDDWYDNQRVDRIYPIHCYRDAIDKLPPDIRDYTGAADAISRALSYAKAGKSDPGPGAKPAPGSTPDSEGYKPVAYRSFGEHQLQAAAAGPPPQASPTTSTSGPSSVPVPLIVLAGLAGLLLVAGGAGYVARRVQSRRGGPPAAS